MQWGVKIPLRDGIHLNATVYLPDDPGKPAPAIFTLTPYIGQRYHEQGLYFAAHGYPFLTVDARGRGNSGGEFRPLIQEAQDGYDVVEWLARQPYCNGKVAMWGCSYMGYAQWATAKEFPAHLATIVPGASPFAGVDFPIRNNIFSTYVMQWLTLVAGRASQDQIFSNAKFWRQQYQKWLRAGVSFKSLDEFIGHSSAVFQEWLAHPCEDAHWDRYNPTPAQYAQLSLPILTITGIYDADQPGALKHYRQHMAHGSARACALHYLVIGPWDHVGTRSPQAEYCGIKIGPEGLVDLAELHVEWYAWTMGSGRRPGFLRKNVAYYVLGAEQWRYADTLEGVTAEYRCLFLDSTQGASRIFGSGILRDTCGVGEPDGYVYDPSDLTCAHIEADSTLPLALRPTFPTDDLRDQTHVFANEGRQLVYHSAPFERSTEISGFFRLEAYIAIDRPDTDFRASVYEISRDGGSILLASDSIRARYRAGSREQKLIDTTDPLQYEFKNFTFVSRQVARGSRLRLVIGPVNSIYFQKNHNSGGMVCEETIQDARPVTVRVFHDRARPSALYLPLAQMAA